MAEHYSDAHGAASKASIQYDGTLYVDVFPTLTPAPLGAQAPDQGDILIRGVTHPAELYADGERKAVKFELNHMYKDGGNVELHARVLPTTNGAGTVIFNYDYYILKANGTTVAKTSGTPVALSTHNVAANDYANGIGGYINLTISGAGLVAGDMIVGQFKRAVDTYADDVALIEVGLHIPVGKNGTTLS